MRAVLFGLTGFGNAALRALRSSGFEVVTVFTRKESGPFPYYPEEHLAEEARRHGIPVWEDADLKSPDTYAALQNLRPDLLLCASYYQKLSPRILSTATYRYNVHPSLLPGFRGATPTNWAIIYGEKETGVTIHVMTPQLDAGGVIAQARIPIGPDETDGQLRKRLADLAGRMLGEALPKLKAAGKPLEATPQDENKITDYPPRTRRDAFIKFDEPSQHVHNRIRGTNPWPGAHTLLNGAEVRILESRRVEGQAYEVQPGLILTVGGGWARVKTKDGFLEIRTEPVLAQGNILGAEVPSYLLVKKKETSMQHTLDRMGLDSRAEEFPLMVVLSVAYPCNALCPHCPYSEWNSDIRKQYSDAPFIDPELFKKIARECGEHGSFLRITGGGEPMLHPKDMASLIEYAKSVGARVWITNNGSMMSPDKADRLLACGCDMVEFSVDAGEPEVYKVVRAGLDWEILVRNVRHMVKQRDQTQAPTRIVVSMIMQDLIKDKAEQYVKFWLEDVGVDEVIKRKFLTWGSNTAIDPSKSADPSPYLDKMAGEPCPFPFHRLNIDTRGKVEVCGFDIRGRTNFGNVRTKTIREIWRGPEFEWWRSMHSAGRGGEIPLCRECPDWQYRSWTHNWEKVIHTADTRRKGTVEIASDDSEVRLAAEHIRGR